MKQTLLLSLVLLLALTAARAQQQVAIYYNQNWEVTKKENASYTRLATVPDSLIWAGSLFTMPFDKAVVDFYSTGKVLARGSYNNGQRQGGWLFFYPNGQLQCQAAYENGKPAGIWKFWRQDGQPEQEVLYNGEEPRVQQYWEKGGALVVANGSGSFQTVLPDSSNGRMCLTGTYLNGKRHGTWVYTLWPKGQAAQPVMQQQYEEGRLVNGQTAKLGSKMVDLLMHGSFSQLQPNFAYLTMLETWSVDTAAFQPDFPVLAYVLRLGVWPLQAGQEPPQQASSYQVVYTSAAGTDTLLVTKRLSRQAAPEFPGGEQAMKSFMRKHIRYPEPAKYFGIEGLVVLSFSVQADGTIGAVEVAKTAGILLDEEALRVLKLMPPWVPASSNNKPIAAKTHLAVKFLARLQPQVYSVDWRD